MNKRPCGTTVLIAVFLLGAVGSVGAQTSRSELMAKGATVLTATELKETLSGSEISGATVTGYQLTWRLNMDGSLKGTASYSTTEIVGKWFVDEKGRFCFEHVSSMGPDSACQVWLKLGRDFYADRDGTILKRTVKKF